MKVKDVAKLAFGSEEEKQSVWLRHVRKVTKRQGFHLLSPHMVWKEQAFFLDAKRRAENVSGINDMRCFVLQSCIRSVASVDGDVAECGVRQGRSTLFMLSADLRPRTYHLFDSFAGLSEPTDDDRDETGTLRWAAGDLSTDEAVARKNLSEFGNVEFHVGWIPDTLPSVADRSFALVHIDVDLYEPTRDALAFFYDRTRSGGIIVCDDYGSAKCPGARKAFDEFLADRPEGLIELPTGQAIVSKR
jgi:hypothetical protein